MAPFRISKMDLSLPQQQTNYPAFGKKNLRQKDDVAKKRGNLPRQFADITNTSNFSEERVKGSHTKKVVATNTKWKIKDALVIPSWAKQTVSSNVKRRWQCETEEEELFLQRTMKDSKQQCIHLVKEHLTSFLEKNPTASYQQWIADLHPENFSGSEIDYRFLIKDNPWILAFEEATMKITTKKLSHQCPSTRSQNPINQNVGIALSTSMPNTNGLAVSQWKLFHTSW